MLPTLSPLEDPRPLPSPASYLDSNVISRRENVSRSIDPRLALSCAAPLRPPPSLLPPTSRPDPTPTLPSTPAPRFATPKRAGNPQSSSARSSELA